MPNRYIEVYLKKRGVRCLARLLDEQAPKTCETVWRALPLEGDVFHAKYASNEIYILAPPLGGEEPGLENRTIVPASGDLLYFFFPQGSRLPQEAKELAATGRGFVDLAVFYDRNNLLLSPSDGFTPGNAFGTIVRNLEGMMKAGHSVWYEGAVGERMGYRRADAGVLKEWDIHD